MQRWIAVFSACAIAVLHTGCPTVQPGTHTVMLPGDVPLDLVWVPEGKFMMGAYDGEEGSTARELPQHEVAISGFWIGKYEVTKRQWEAVMKTSPWLGERTNNDLDSPAVFITWNDAKSFCQELSNMTSMAFRLPSESEWEYACRSGTKTRFYWGDDLDLELINLYAWTRYSPDEDTGSLRLHVVGAKKPNDWGIFDAIGNAAEWCEDDLSPWNYDGAPVDGSAYTEEPRDIYRIVRGGSYASYQQHCRSASRGWAWADFARNDGLGFRVAR